MVTPPARLRRRVPVLIVGVGRELGAAHGLRDPLQPVDGVVVEGFVGGLDAGRDLLDAIASQVVLVRDRLFRVSDRLQPIDEIIGVLGGLGSACIRLDLPLAVGARVIEVLIRAHDARRTHVRDVRHPVGSVVLVRRDGGVGVGDLPLQAVREVLMRHRLAVTESEGLEAVQLIVRVLSPDGVGVDEEGAIALWIVIVGERPAPERRSLIPGGRVRRRS